MREEIKEILDDFKNDVENNLMIEVRGIYYKPLLDYITNLQEENKRLNNIINELEKWIKEDKEYAMNNFECGRCFNMFDILDKLKELKGSDDNV